MIIFVASYPRSGTTFLAKSCVEKLGFYSIPESHFLHDLYEELAKSKCKRISYEKLGQILNNSFKFRVWNVSIPHYEFIDASNIAELFYRLVAAYNEVDLESIQNGIVIDHTPENTLWISEHLRYFGNACKILPLMRDPRSLFNSIKDLRWGPNTAYYFCKHFVKYLDIIDTYVSKSSSDICYYEELIKNLDENISKFGNNLGYYEKNLSSKFELPGYTKSQHTLVEKKHGQNKRINAWQTELDTTSIQYIESFFSSKKYAVLNDYDFPLSGKVDSNIFFTFIDEYYKKIKNKFYRKKLERSI
ncbi:sulfotransferase [Alteromonas sp. C1M14]|uniref:sulfotransferase n=1 Tax=Alteromonas sp. C1M14 TaxID=2841567 RepID=UPI001C085D06|nr:sulfotransferase [Alteromonas sp. C1M14]MBU2979946.1 sulfotransferase [Alteromonas sp. C1M14]